MKLDCSATGVSEFGDQATPGATRQIVVPGMCKHGTATRGIDCLYRLPHRWPQRIDRAELAIAEKT